MPIYEYGCERCGTFEVTQRITDNPLRRCPTCKGKVRKLISSTSFQLKGSGWYVTDYAAKSSAKGKEEGKADSGDTKKDGADSKADSKKDSSESSKPVKSDKSGGKSEATAA